MQTSTKFAILVPTKFEAQLVPEKIRNKNFFVISGILKLTTSKIRTLTNKEGIKKIILLGFAGDLSGQKKAGELFNINSVTNKKEIIQLKTINELNIPSTSCLTVTKPVYTEQKRKDLSIYADLVEMECFWAAKICEEKNIEFYSVRIVSDSCNTNLCDYFFLKKAPSPDLINAQKKLAETAATIAKLYCLFTLIMVPIFL